MWMEETEREERERKIIYHASSCYRFPLLFLSSGNHIPIDQIYIYLYCSGMGWVLISMDMHCLYGLSLKAGLTVHMNIMTISNTGSLYNVSQHNVLPHLCIQTCYNCQTSRFNPLTNRQLVPIIFYTNHILVVWVGRILIFKHSKTINLVASVCIPECVYHNH